MRRRPAVLRIARDLRVELGQATRPGTSASAVTAARVGRELRDPGLEDRDRLRRRRDLVQAGEPERVVPRLADGARPGELRAGRGALAGEPVARVETPQAAVAVDPAVRRR